MARGRCRMVMRCEPNSFTEPRPYRPPALKHNLFQQKRLAELREGSQVSVEIQSDKSLKGTEQDQTTLVSGIDIQEKSSSDVVASTSKPQTPSPSLVGMKKTLGSQVSLLRCSTCMQIIQSDKSLKGSSDQDQTTLVSQIYSVVVQIGRRIWHKKRVGFKYSLRASSFTDRTVHPRDVMTRDSVAERIGSNTSMLLPTQSNPLFIKIAMLS
ncbi:unnamed protein product [Brassica rapa subsp. trilocularis]